MKSIIDQILQWPIIVQGALGSALFWIILKIGDFAFRKSGSKIRGYSKQHQLGVLRTEWVRYKALADGDANHLVVLLYSAMHDIVKALLSLCLAFVFQSIFPVFGYVGYAMAIYFLFLAGVSVRDTKGDCDPKAELKRIEEEIEKLESEA
jgi:hypothetical protein